MLYSSFFYCALIIESWILDVLQYRQSFVEIEALST
jgi:hypothetical protein